MLDTGLAIPFWFELTATVTSAMTGALAATREKYDILGTIMMAIIIGLFGGVMRDVLLQDYGIYAFQRPELIIACVICAVVVFYFGRLVKLADPLIEIMDIIQCGLWAVIGAGKAIAAGLGIVPTILLGMLTAVGGGIVRDVALNHHIVAFTPGSLYASAAAISASAYAIMRTYHILDHWSALICVLLGIGIRIASLEFGWRTKPARDLTIPMADALAKPVRALKGKDKLADLGPADISSLAAHARKSVKKNRHSTRGRDKTRHKHRL